MRIVSTLVIALAPAVMLLSSCDRYLVDPVFGGDRSEYYEVVVVADDIDCSGEWGIRFTGDLQKIYEITGIERDLYSAKNLPAEHQQPGKTLRLKFRNPIADELYACPAIYPTYPLIVVTGVK